MNNKIFYTVALLLIACTTSVFAQTKTLTMDDYARAEKMLGYNTSPLVDRAGVRPTFLPDGKFWYPVLTPTGREFVLVNPADGSKKPAASLADLGVAGSATLQGFRRGGGDVASPDGKKSAYIKDWNLWMRDNETKKETQLTTDGIKDFGYATDNAGWTRSDRAILVWSPDSKKIATFQQDQRHVSDMYFVSTNVGAPKLEAWKYPIPQDKEIIKIIALSSKLMRQKWFA